MVTSQLETVSALKAETLGHHFYLDFHFSHRGTIHATAKLDNFESTFGSRRVGPAFLPRVPIAHHLKVQLDSRSTLQVG